MYTHLYKDALGWGFLLWLFGYVAGIILFFMVPPALLGWILTPIGTLLTLWVLFKKIETRPFRQYVYIAGTWLALAIVCDYLFLVLLLAPTDGYYKTDVYVYYAITALLPLAVGWYRGNRRLLI